MILLLIGLKIVIEVFEVVFKFLVICLIGNVFRNIKLIKV